MVVERQRCLLPHNAAFWIRIPRIDDRSYTELAKSGIVCAQGPIFLLTSSQCQQQDSCNKIPCCSRILYSRQSISVSSQGFSNHHRAAYNTRLAHETSISSHQQNDPVSSDAPEVPKPSRVRGVLRALYQGLEVGRTEPCASCTSFYLNRRRCWVWCVGRCCNSASPRWLLRLSVA